MLAVSITLTNDSLVDVLYYNIFIIQYVLFTAILYVYIYVYTHTLHITILYYITTIIFVIYNTVCILRVYSFFSCLDMCIIII